MSFMHHVRRRAHRTARLPRHAWRRAYSYRKDRVPGYNLPVYTPESRDAPYDDVDARFWDWVLVIMILGVVVGLIIAGVRAI